jgi:hypothetical protein
MSCSKHLGKTTFIINSKDKVSGNNGRFSIDLHFPIENITKCRLIGVKIPNIFYNITSANNKIIIEEAGSVFFDIIIPDGAWSVDEITHYIKTELNDKTSYLTGGYECDYSLTTQRLTISNSDITNGFALFFESDSPANLMGFIVNGQYNPHYTHTAPKPYDFEYPHLFYIRITEIPCNNYTFDGKQFTFILLQSVNAGEYLLNISNDCNNTLSSCEYSIKHFNVELYDENFKNVIPNLDWQIILEFTK